MRKVSDALPTSQRPSQVAEFIDRRLSEIQKMSGKTIGQIADEVGLPQRNMLSMIRTGVTKLPFERIRGMAKALDVDLAKLLRLALEEYQPQLEELLNEVRGQILRPGERKIIALWRARTGDHDPSIEPFAAEFESLIDKLLAPSSGGRAPADVKADKSVVGNGVKISLD